MGAAVRAGVAEEAIVVDPGIGFGKSLDHNLALLRGLGVIASLGRPVLVGASRKGMIGALTGRGVAERLAGSLGAALAAVAAGASVLRVHDVAETVDALRVFTEIRRGGA
jgi:dihydropteroate synthase